MDAGRLLKPADGLGGEAVLSHEATHVRFGADEGAAYEAELNALRRLNAPTKIVMLALQSRDRVLARNIGGSGAPT